MGLSFCSLFGVWTASPHLLHLLILRLQAFSFFLSLICLLRGPEQRYKFLSTMSSSSKNAEQEAPLEQAVAPRSPVSQKSCYRLFRGEINPCQPWFLVNDKSGRKIDICASFAPNSYPAILWKVLVAGFSVFSIIWTWIKSETPSYYLAYLTNWCLLIASAYLIGSMIATLRAENIVQPPQAVHGPIAVMWILFSVAAHSQFIVTVLYWILVFDYNESPSFLLDFVPHGGILLLVWIDGLVINRIPVRWMHWWGTVLPFEMLWVAWSILQSVVFDIGNPNENDGDGNDDAIYESLDWNDDAWGAALLTVIVLFAVGPAVYWVLWMCSWYKLPICCFCKSYDRRYVNTAVYIKPSNDRPVADEEEGSAFENEEAQVH